MSAVTHQSFPSIPCCEACIDYSLLYLLSLNFPGEEKEHSLNMESLKRSTWQTESQNLTSQSPVISCTILRVLGVPCTNSAPFSGDVFIHFTDVKPLQGFSSQSFHLSTALQGEEGRNHLHILRAELCRNGIDRAGVIEGKMLFKRSIQFGVHVSRL